MKVKLQCGRYQLDLRRPQLMGIVNLTADSFSGDGWNNNAQQAIAHGLQLVAEGADLLDLGAESSRPGATPISAAEELERLLPVITGLHDCGVPLSIDTTKAEVMRAALAAGADMVNDITACNEAGMIDLLVSSRAAVCLMHMQGEPRTMQQAPHYDNVAAEVRNFLAERRNHLLAAGVAAERIVLDPGFGFGKTLSHNLSLLRELPAMQELQQAVLVGLSRKSMLGQLTGRAVDERLHASVAAALLAVERGAHILRVHDVAATRDALTVWQAVQAV